MIQGDLTVRQEDARSRDGNALPALGIAQGLATPIARTAMLVVTKRSRLERDQHDLGLSHEELLTRYEKMGQSGVRVLGSHVRQQEAKEICERELGKERVIYVEDLTERLKASEVEVVIVLGGDDFLKLVSQYIDDIPVLGVNSDPSMSTGCLLSTSIDQIGSAISTLESGHYRREAWTRIALRIDGRDYGDALGDVVLGKRDFRHMSRHTLEFCGETVEQRSSGLLVASGSGSTGWFASAGLYLGSEDRSFERSAPELHFELREPYVHAKVLDGQRTVILPSLCEGRILPGETIRITSLNDRDGIASRDSLDQIPFERGAVAEISVSQKPLQVVIPEVMH